MRRTAEVTGRESASAGGHSGSAAACIAIIGGVVGADMAIRTYVNRNYPDQRVRLSKDGRFVFRKVHNDGSAFDLMKGNQRLIIGSSGVMIGSLLGSLALGLREGENPVSMTGLSLLIGGALGNFIERIAKGSVTDYVSCRRLPGSMKKYYFNLSDICIFSGTMLHFLSKTDN